MKRIIFGLMVGSALFTFAACDSQRISTTTETTTTTEPVVTAPTETAAPADTTTHANMDSGEISEEIAASGAFVSEADFITKAAQSGMAEVKLGALAERKATNPEVKQFGVKMVQDHTRANNLLLRIAQKRKISTPSDMDAEHQQAYSKLATVMSDEFDQGYMAQMVTDHEMAVAMFQQASTQVTDAELKSFVTTNLPALKMHLGMARDLQKKVEASR